MADENNNNLPAAAKEIVHQVDPLIQGLPADKQAQVRRTIVAQVTKYHRGPLPDPETLASYDAIIDRGAERLMSLVEKRSAHAIRQESIVIATQAKLAVRGQIIGALLALGGAWPCGLRHDTWASGARRGHLHHHDIGRHYCFCPRAQAG